MQSAAAVPFGFELVSETVVVFAAVDVAAAAAAAVGGAAAEGDGASVAVASNFAGPAELSFSVLLTGKRLMIQLGQVQSC